MHNFAKISKESVIIMKTLLKDLEEKFESIQALKLLALNNDEALLAYLAHHTKAREAFFFSPPPPIK